MEMIKSEEQKEKRLNKSKQSLRDLREIIKRANDMSGEFQKDEKEGGRVNI